MVKVSRGARRGGVFQHGEAEMEGVFFFSQRLQHSRAACVSVFRDLVLNPIQTCLRIYEWKMN
jgi:hypothetical protein